MASLSRVEASLALFEIKNTFKNIKDEEWENLRPQLWSLISADLKEMSPWIKAKLCSLPDTGKFWTDLFESEK